MSVISENPSLSQHSFRSTLSRVRTALKRDERVENNVWKKRNRMRRPAITFAVCFLRNRSASRTDVTSACDFNRTFRIYPVVSMYLFGPFWPPLATDVTVKRNKKKNSTRRVRATGLYPAGNRDAVAAVTRMYESHTKTMEFIIRI